jgi:hypothetical protein
MDKKNSKDKQIMKASRLLQAKIGRGAVDEKTILKSQKIIDNNDFDFVPMGEEFLQALDKALGEAKKAESPSAANLLEELREPVMQLKANAAMFGYPLVSVLASIMLNFLESVKTLDRDVIEIVDAHRRTLEIIIRNKMQGEGGDYGVELQKELRNACRRYFAKQASTGTGDDEPFFIE